MVGFNAVSLVGPELDNIAQAVENGRLCGDGEFTQACQGEIERTIGSGRALLTHSCTAALELSAILTELAPDDEVIMPSFTFVSTANAIVLRGAVPVFVDIDVATRNIDPTLIEAAITPRTRAIVVVHYAGVPADMDQINAIAERHRLFVIEDAAQAYGSTYKGRPCGALGDIGCFSFHETKNVISGEGGAIVVQDKARFERAEMIWEKGTNRKQFLRGAVDKYTWQDVGSSYLPSELIAAFLLPQLRAARQINGRRLEIWERYHAAFASLHQRGLIERPAIPDYAQHNAHMYYILPTEQGRRDALITALHNKEIGAAFHYVPLHSAPAGRKFARTGSDMNITDHTSENLVRLPLHTALGDEQQERAIEAVLRFFE
jgi:dTDP-4-amino-4,6-dideoxygalactose transaminase